MFLGYFYFRPIRPYSATTFSPGTTWRSRKTWPYFIGCQLTVLIAVQCLQDLRSFFYFLRRQLSVAVGIERLRNPIERRRILGRCSFLGIKPLPTENPKKHGEDKTCPR